MRLLTCLAPALLLAFSAVAQEQPPLPPEAPVQPPAQESVEAPPQVMQAEQPQAVAGSSLETRMPLLLIRFAERNVFFDRALYNAVSKAVAVKPGVVFDVALKPGSNSTASRANLEKVINAMAKMGVPSTQIIPVQSSPSGQAWDEVAVFVR